MGPLLDPDILEDFDYLSRKQGRDVYAEMTARLVRSWPERLQQLEQAKIDRSASALARHLHSLKGTAASLGLQQLAALAGAAEQAAQQGAIDIDLVGLEAAAAAGLAAAQARRSG